MGFIQNLSKFTAEEQAVICWQFKYDGGFFTALWEAISMADEQNLDRLAEGFPTEVAGYRKYTRESGWWSSVEKRWRESS